ncbi:U1 small nuclear ribonucleoprotein 70 kDa, putative [Entamoeba invadens IP1]|uniref:U1 small nuclear ribonucleoprotein 70 kDa, putative n=1 Tax=Entamoeba invadens IP1 TaxID=370355 RepID=UPI0002C3D048|nr:U1 small nuclear ribonucleoprotein 70 kDa, putative [Entamoeba invadens IP1]ELP93844.1 U1 small nuclear ribonucleoprotein 70 kDa, putative [Entamoeba invadens IP1]|eukprot:XP_004260615.1 U1 small nuclear ribonucleoprotein 70 kDa, putative [Entamoeba invadens IP1]
MTTLYVSDVDGSITEEKLKNLFDPFGVVLKFYVIENGGKKTWIGSDGTATIKKSCKGPNDFFYAFVEYGKEEEASKALKAMDQYEIAGKRLNVKFAKLKEGKSFSRHSPPPLRDYDRDDRDFERGRREDRDSYRPLSPRNRSRSTERPMRREQRDERDDYFRDRPLDRSRDDRDFYRDSRDSNRNYPDRFSDQRSGTMLRAPDRVERRYDDFPVRGYRDRFDDRNERNERSEKRDENSFRRVDRFEKFDRAARYSTNTQDEPIYPRQDRFERKNLLRDESRTYEDRIPVDRFGGERRDRMSNFSERVPVDRFGRDRERTPYDRQSTDGPTTDRGSDRMDVDRMRVPDGLRREEREQPPREPYIRDRFDSRGY